MTVTLTFELGVSLDLWLYPSTLGRVTDSFSGTSASTWDYIYLVNSLVDGEDIDNFNPEPYKSYAQYRKRRFHRGLVYLGIPHLVPERAHGAPDQKVMEGYREGLRAETPKGPFGQTAVGRAVDGGGLKVLAEYQGRMHGSGTETPRRGGGE